MKPLRVLIVRIGAMGDVLHAMPAVAALRERHPQSFIGWAIEPRWSDLLQIAGDSEDLSQGIGPQAKALVDRWYSVPASAWKRRPFARATLREIDVLRHVLKAEKFDVCVDLQGALKSAAVGRMAGAKIFAGAEEPRERIARWFYRQRVKLTSGHVVEQACELLGTAIGEELRPAKVTLPMDAQDELRADGLVGQERMCLISPAAGWGAKVWPAERYGAVAAALGNAGFQVLVNASAGAASEADRVVAASEGFAQPVTCTIGKLIALTRRAALVIAGDTGPLHLAAALERPVVGIYGPTSPARNGPWGTRSRVLRDPSSVTSHKRISEPEPGMLRISVEEVVQAALEMLG
jgi:heptosyltransferase-1